MDRLRVLNAYSFNRNVPHLDPGVRRPDEVDQGTGARRQRQHAASGDRGCCGRRNRGTYASIFLWCRRQTLSPAARARARSLGVLRRRPILMRGPSVRRVSCRQRRVSWPDLRSSPPAFCRECSMCSQSCLRSSIPWCHRSTARSTRGRRLRSCSSPSSSCFTGVLCESSEVSDGFTR